MKIKYDVSLMKFMSMFERITHAQLKDCFLDENTGTLTFVVQPGQIGKAVGKKGANIKKLENAFKRKIRVIEFHPDKLEFIRNMILPLRVEQVIEEDEGVVVIQSSDPKVKGLLIGRNGANLRNLENNVRRYFDIKEIKVV